MANCRSCSARIIWAKTAKGGSMPLDATPTIDGNLELRAGVAHYVTPDANAVPMRHRSHFSTCPQAAQHRKPKEPTP